MWQIDDVYPVDKFCKFVQQYQATAMNKQIEFRDLGLQDYNDVWQYQEKLFQDTVDLKIRNRREERSLETKNHLLFVEHPHVYTLGKSGDIENLLLNEKQLEAKGATYYKVNRGGDITYHGPGQIVGYPILDLDNFFTDIHKYLRFLEEAIILTIADYGLKGTRSDGETGVWLDVGTPFARKICAMGVRASRWVTMHGFALNVNVNLGYFDNIIPCGIRGKAVTSMHAELGKAIDEAEVKQKILHYFAELFEAEIIDKTTEDNKSLLYI
jgi:lipoyl(octanoyl) transferase